MIPFGVRKTAARALKHLKESDGVGLPLIGLASRLASNVYSEQDCQSMRDYFANGRPTGVEWGLYGGLKGKRWATSKD